MTSTKSQPNEIDAAAAELFEAMSDFVSKNMSTRRDFFNLIDMIVDWLKIFRESHSEIVTQKVAEDVCQFTVYDISNDDEWQEAIRFQFIELVNSGDFSEEELEPLARWVNSAYQLEYGVPRPASTYLRLVDSESMNPVLEVKVW